MGTARLTLNALTGLGCLGIGLAVPSPLGVLPHVPGAHPDGPLIERATASALDVVGSIKAALNYGRTASAPPNRLAYAPDPVNVPLSPAPPAAPPPEPEPVFPAEASALLPVLSAYRAGDLAAGDLAAAAIQDPLVRLTAEWAALRLQPRAAGFDRLKTFLDAHPAWVGNTYLRRRAEEVLYAEKRAPVTVRDFFAQRPPETVYGKVALARVLQAEGQTDAATTLIRAVWRTGELSTSLEGSIRKEFPDALTKADHKVRSDRAFYKEQSAQSARAAGYGGADLTALVKARDSLSDKAIAALPAELRKDPTLIFARIQKLRRDNKLADAAQAMLAAPRDAASLVVPDEWWTERRLIARKLIDQGDAATAYRIAAEHAAEGNEARLEAEFHAGWIALRFLQDATKAAPHFDLCAKIATSPMSQSRATYWQGRAAEAAGDAEKAKTYFEAAATHSSTYYGQLARAKLGLADLPVRMPRQQARGDQRDEAVRALELLAGLEQKDLVAPLAADAARTLSDETQLGALASVVANLRDPRMTLTVGKLAGQRGFALDETAFPIFGVPLFEPLARSAPLQVVYAIARQESAFEARAQSSAGAKGLMQMLPSTARRTAQNAGVSFDESRLTNDAAFNAQLGAAHLGELLGEQRGSLILTFAAYNAGGRRVKEWIAAHGDPRDASVDPVDWVELIPFTETRNYVQRVVENLEMYRARFGQTGGFNTENTLRAAHARP